MWSFWLFLLQVCGPPGFMKAVSGDKAPDKSQGEVISTSFQLSSEDRVIKFCHLYLQMAIYLTSIVFIDSNCSFVKRLAFTTSSYSPVQQLNNC